MEKTENKSEFDLWFESLSEEEQKEYVDDMIADQQFNEEIEEPTI